jgi:SAM-dependent methyltransferase
MQQRPEAAFDPDIPSTARIYDYILGGKDHFAADREAAEQLIAAQPASRATALANRGFLLRAVDTLARSGIRQFLDIGAGIPTSPNVHEVVQEVAPDARIAYVDNDPVVLAHTRALRATAPGVIAVDGDVRHPEEILEQPQLRDHLDFDEPVALLLVAVLHFVRREDDPAALIEQYTKRLAPGSCLALTVGSSAGYTAEEVARIEAPYRNASSPLTLHDPAEVARWFSGYELLDPGLVSIFKWRADEPEPPRVSALGGVGRLRRG